MKKPTPKSGAIEIEGIGIFSVIPKWWVLVFRFFQFWKWDYRKGK